MEIWFDEHEDENNPYRVVQSDDGGEWADLKPIFEKYNIKHSISTRPQAQSIVERCNQTIRRLLAKNIIQKNADSRWNLIDLVERNYNNSYHSSIKMTPNEKFKIVSQKKIDKLNKDQDVKANLVVMNRKPIINSSAELEPNDWVRVKKVKKNPLDKSRGYNNWSIDVYIVNRIIRAIKAGLQQRYELKKLDGGVLRKRFYRDDLLKIPNDTSLDDREVGKVNDNPPDITEEEILFEVKPEPEIENTKSEKSEKPKKKREKPVIQPREKSTRNRKAPQKLDL